MAGKTYVSAVPLTMVRTVSGGYQNVLQGDPIPGEAVDPKDLKRLVRKGFLKEFKEVEKKAESAKPSVPAKSAAKADWVAYATDEARGNDRLTPEDADGKTRDELAEFFTPKA